MLQEATLLTVSLGTEMSISKLLHQTCESLATRASLRRSVIEWKGVITRHNLIVYSSKVTGSFFIIVDHTEHSFCCSAVSTMNKEHLQYG